MPDNSIQISCLLIGTKKHLYLKTRPLVLVFFGTTIQVRQSLIKASKLLLNVVAMKPSKISK